MEENFTPLHNSKAAFAPQPDSVPPSPTCAVREAQIRSSTRVPGSDQLKSMSLREYTTHLYLRKRVVSEDFKSRCDSWGSILIPRIDGGTKLAVQRRH